MPELETKSLPECAYEPLKPGESYPPIVSADISVPELTARSVGWGIFLCIIFTIAAAYSGLKVGQVMESAIPISILAIGLARLYRRRSSLQENVIITGIGGVAGPVVAGAVFTIPALYILKLDPHPVQTIFVCLAGGCLGVLFLIPLRLYFVRDMHGKLPYPEATAIAEVLVTGEKGRLTSQASAASDRPRGCLRFVRYDVPGLEGVRGFPVRSRVSHSLRTGPDGVQLRCYRIHPRPRICNGAAQFHDPLCGRCPFKFRAGAIDMVHRQSSRQCGVSGRGSDLEHDCRANLSQLRAICRRRGNRDRGHIRNRQIVEDRGQFIRNCTACFPEEGDFGGGARRS